MIDVEWRWLTVTRGGVSETKSWVAETAVRLTGTNAATVLTDILQVETDIGQPRLTQLII